MDSLSYIVECGNRDGHGVLYRAPFSLKEALVLITYWRKGENSCILNCI